MNCPHKDQMTKTRSGEPAPPGSPSVSQPVPPASGDQFPKPKDPKQKFPSEGSLFAHVKVTCNLPWTCCMLHVAVLLPHKGKKETRHNNREKRTVQPPSFIEFQWKFHRHTRSQNSFSIYNLPPCPPHPTPPRISGGWFPELPHARRLERVGGYSV